MGDDPGGREPPHLRERDFRAGRIRRRDDIGARLQGQLGPAEAHHQQALKLARELDSSWDEAHALAGLGRCAVAAGRDADGIAGLQQAEAIFRRLGIADAADVAAELAALGAGGLGSD